LYVEVGKGIVEEWCAEPWDLYQRITLENCKQLAHHQHALEERPTFSGFDDEALS